MGCGGSRRERGRMLNNITSIITFGRWHSVTFSLFSLHVCFVSLKSVRLLFERTTHTFQWETDTSCLAGGPLWPGERTRVKRGRVVKVINQEELPDMFHLGSA